MCSSPPPLSSAGEKLSYQGLERKSAAIQFCVFSGTGERIKRLNTDYLALCREHWPTFKNAQSYSHKLLIAESIVSDILVNRGGRYFKANGEEMSHEAAVKKTYTTLKDMKPRGAASEKKKRRASSRPQQSPEISALDKESTLVSRTETSSDHSSVNKNFVPVSQLLVQSQEEASQEDQSPSSATREKLRKETWFECDMFFTTCANPGTEETPARGNNDPRGVEGRSVTYESSGTPLSTTDKGLACFVLGYQEPAKHKVIGGRGLVNFEDDLELYNVLQDAALVGLNCEDPEAIENLANY